VFFILVWLAASEAYGNPAYCVVLVGDINVSIEPDAWGLMVYDGVIRKGKEW